jgi:hypothetical protein
MTAPLPSLLPLSGLSENNPRDFLASLGLLRLISLQWPTVDARLSWNVEKGHPIIHTSIPLPGTWDADLVQSIQSLAAHPERPLFHGHVIRTSPTAFRIALQKAIRFSETDDHPLRAIAPLLYAAYSSQNDEDGELHISALSFANGGSGKNLLLDVSQLIAALKPASLSGALDGTAPAIDAKSLRWHPQEFRAAAFRGHNPGDGIKGDDSLDHPAFNVLAFFGLTFLPCVPTARNGLTPAIHRVDGESAFLWPIWHHPLSPDSVTSLLHQPPASVGRAHGVARRWKSRRMVVGKKKTLYFSPATVATL